MKIDKVVFNNFRNYKGKQLFKLNNQVTILYGENGNGKSSFFDGIEWCLTGTISRFPNNKVSKEAIANKDIRLNEECYVELHFSTFFLKRTFKFNETGFSNVDFSIYLINQNRSYQKLDSGEINVDRVLRDILEQNGVKYRDIKYKVGEIVNKAYILSQDQVTDFVTREKPSDRYNALASIMGFERVLKLRKNLDSTLKSIEDITDSYLEKKKEIEDKKSYLNTNLKDINVNVLNQFKLIYDFEPNSNSDIEEELKKNQEKLIIIENQINELQSLKYVEANTLSDIDKILYDSKLVLAKLEEDLEDIVVQQNKFEEEKVKIQSLIKKLSENEKFNITYNNIIKTINENSRELYDLNLSEKDLKSLKEKLEFLYLTKRKFEFYNANYQDYVNSQQFLLEYDNKYNGILNSLKLEEIIYDQIISEKQLLEEELLRLDNNSTLNNLIRSIENIATYIENRGINDICPVCSSEVDNNLQVRVQSNLEGLILQTNDIKNIVVKKLQDKKKLEFDEVEKKNTIQKLKFELQQLDTKLSISNQTIQNIVKNTMFSNFFNLERGVALETLSTIQKEISIFEKAMDLTNNINNLKAKLSEISINHERTDLNQEELKINLKNLENETNQLDNLLKKNKKETSDLKHKIFKLGEVKKKYELFFENYNVNSLVHLEIRLNSENNILEERLNLLKSLVPIIENKHYNKSIYQEINKIDKEILETNNLVTRAINKYSKVNTILSNLDKEYGDEAADFLNSNKSAIQMYYRYLNPVPTRFNNLYFEIIDNEELNIKIFEKTEQDGKEEQYFADANMVLSSGQLNVLALAIFIATNEAQNCSYFDFIAIDDPIQNMDDVNRFSICDVLGKLNRQLIFSTHDQEFLNLFLKKNEYQMENISLFMLDAEENQYKSLALGVTQ